MAIDLLIAAAMATAAVGQPSTGSGHVTTVSNYHLLKSGTLRDTTRRYCGVDDVRRPGFNGRAFNGRAVAGNTGWGSGDCRTPGAAAYGAEGEDVLLIVDAWPYQIAIDPFENVDLGKLGVPHWVRTRAEDARNQWLRDHGYTGGVRTFTNGAAPEKKKAEITPRATIKLPADATKFKSRMEVRSKAAPGGKIAVRVHRPGETFSPKPGFEAQVKVAMVSTR